MLTVHFLALVGLKTAVGRDVSMSSASRASVLLFLFGLSCWLV